MIFVYACGKKIANTSLIYASDITFFLIKMAALIL